VVGPGDAPEQAHAPAAIEGQKGAAAALAEAWDLPRRDIYRALTELKDRLKGV
jgi:hypothetical protein